MNSLEIPPLSAVYSIIKIAKIKKDDTLLKQQQRKKKSVLQEQQMPTIQHIDEIV